MSLFKRISAADAQQMMADKPVAIADIRDAMSYRAGHISNATLLDNSNLQEFMNNTSKEGALVVCCYHGNSSQQAAQFLAEQGYSDVYSLDGGYEAWKSLYPEQCER